MDLFDLIDGPHNLLPGDGTVIYSGAVMSSAQATAYFDELFGHIEWKNDETFIFGRHIVTKRKVAWYGDKPYEYSYSNTTKCALPWTDSLLLLKAVVEKKTQETYNSCLVNLYHSGEEGMGWHSDDETDLKTNGAICSLSLGAERKFAFKHKRNKTTVSLILEDGSVLVMKGSTQTHWAHQLPRMKSVSQPRINLTFRTIAST